MKNFSEPVDAVITWVDGEEAAHREKLTTYCTTYGINSPIIAAEPTRFNQRGEIDYCVRSLLHFAPWIRTIFIVTDAQTPAIMQQIIGTPYQKKIKLIDHRDIFAGYENYLPTFNSLTIESMLWRIKDLANNFIYLNDDCSIIRPVKYEDFFRDNKVVVRGDWKVHSAKKWHHYWKKMLPPPPHRRVQETSASLAGWSKHYYDLPHAPFALKKDTFTDYFLTHPELLSKNINFALRDPQQFWPISLAQHLEIKNKRVILDNSLRSITVHGACHSLHKIKTRLARAARREKVAFICVQSLDEAPLETQQIIIDWLSQKIPSLGMSS